MHGKDKKEKWRGVIPNPSKLGCLTYEVFRHKIKRHGAPHK